jgi:hypothetical protein
MALFMDISRNDKGEVNSVVVGCDCSPSARAVSIFIKEAQAWARWHNAVLHPKQAMNMEQIGCALSNALAKQNAPDREIKPKTYSQHEVMDLMRGKGEWTTQQVAEATGRRTKDATKLMRRMEEKGTVIRTRKVGKYVYWIAVNDTQDLLEAS